MSASKADIGFCWEQVHKRDPWFRLHYLFAPRKRVTQVLALHALFSMIEGTLEMSEESLCMSQLLWWRSELETDKARVSAHPVIRTMRDGLDTGLFSTHITDPLIAQVLLRLQAEPVTDEIALKNICHSIGKSKIVAEISIIPDEASNQDYSGQCAGLGLACLLEFVIQSSQRSWWFVPMDLQARHQIDSEAIDHQSTESTQVLQALRQWGAIWFEEQINDLALVALTEARRHLVAMVYTRKLRFEASLQDLLEGGHGEPGRWRLPDFFRVWSSSRRAMS